jgi:putative exporter of polyketide antibiotics
MPVSRLVAYGAALTGVAVSTAILWLAATLALVAARLPVGGSAYLALATIAAVPLFGGVGAVASQLAATRRGALQIGLAVVAIAYLLRVVADIRRSGRAPLGDAARLGRGAAAVRRAEFRSAAPARRGGRRRRDRRVRVAPAT